MTMLVARYDRERAMSLSASIRTTRTVASARGSGADEAADLATS
jgi:hypothetical protein